MSTLFEKMTAIADNIRSLLGLTEKLGLDAMTENLETANTEVESQKNIIEQLRAVISEKAGKPLGGSIDDLIDGSITEISSNVESVRDYAFYLNGKIVTAKFPLATSIGASSFSSATGLLTVDAPKVTTLGNGAFWTCKNLINVNIPNVTAISNNGFRECSKLPIIDLPNVTHIDGYGFYACSKLRALLLRSSVVCTLSNISAFTGSLIHTYYGTGYIYVPSALIEDYKVATNWTSFASQFRALEDYTVDGTITGELDESKI